MCAAVPFSSFSQQSFARVDVRCLRSDNVVMYRVADTNVAVGYGTWRPTNPRSIISAQLPITTNWVPVAFQFSVAKGDTVKLIFRGRYRETEDLELDPPEWVWVDNVSLTDGNGEELAKNGSFEKLDRGGRPEKWGYDGLKMSTPKPVPAYDGKNCLGVSFKGAAFYEFRARSNVWYTVRAFFRSE
jgi:hypothetical protein